MRFYLVYFSVLVPLIFAVFNYSLGQTTSTEQQTITENHNIISTSSTPRQTSLSMNISTIIQPNKQNHSSHEQLELRSPLITNLSNKYDASSATPSSSSTLYSTPYQHARSTTRGKRKYFANHLYENTRNMFIR
jgi:hypothetical protein